MAKKQKPAGDLLAQFGVALPGASKVSKPPKPVVSKPKSGKKKPSVGRPAPMVALHDRYGLVYEPGEDADPIVKAELDALRELYRERTNREIADEEDTRSALERANLLRPPKTYAEAPTKAIEFRQRRVEQDELFASAMDALDAVQKQLRKVKTPQGVVLDALRDERVRGAIGQVRTPLDVAADVPIGLAAKGIEAGVERLRSRPAPEIKPGLIRTPVPESKDRRSFTERVSQLPAGIKLGIETTPGAAEKVNVIGKAGPFYLYSEPGLTLGEEARGMAVSPLGEPIRVSDSEFEAVTRNALGVVPQTPDAIERAKKIVYIGKSIQNGLAVSDAQSMAKQIDLGELTDQERSVYLENARKLGWDISDPNRYTDLEVMKRGLTRPSFEGEAARSLFRQIGDFAALPSAMLVLGEAVVKRDREALGAISEEMIAPYLYLLDDADRRGVGPALSSFAQERPLDAILIANGIVRGAGRAAAVGARTFGGQNVAGAQLSRIIGAPAPPRPSRFTAPALRAEMEAERAASGRVARARGTVGEFARVGREIRIPSPAFEVQRAGVSETSAIPIPVGYASKNLLDVFAREAEALAIRGGLKARLPGASRLASRRSGRAMRRVSDIKDDAAARASLLVQDTMAGLTLPQQIRLALELTVAPVSVATGGAYSFAERAAFFRRTAEQARRDAEDPALAKSRRENLARAKRADDQAKFAEQVAATPLDPQRIQQAREIVRELGDDNDTVIAMILGDYDAIENPSGLSRSRGTVADLRVGSRINVSRAGQLLSPQGFSVDDAGDVVPARVASVRDLGGGNVEFTYRNILTNETSDGVVASRLDPIVQLRPGVNAAKYVRQFAEADEALTMAAEEAAKRMNEPVRGAFDQADAAVRRAVELDRQRGVIGNQLERILRDSDAARMEGRLSRSRQLGRSYQKRVTRLLRVLREMENRSIDAADQLRVLRNEQASRVAGRYVDEAELDRIDAEIARMDQLAAFARNERLNVARTRGRYGEDILAVEPRAVTQRRVVESIRAGDVSPAVTRLVEQPEAREFLRAADIQERRAAEFRSLEQRLMEERAAAPSAARAGRARRELPEVERDVAALREMAARGSRIPEGMEGVWDDLFTRLSFLRDSRVLSKNKSQRKLFNALSRQDVMDASSRLRALRQRIRDNAVITGRDIDEIEAIERIIVKYEKRLSSYKSFEQRPAGVRNTPVGFGRLESRGRIGGPETAPRARALAAAGERAERADVLRETISERERVAPITAPEGKGPSIADIRRSRRDAEKAASRARREAIKIIQRGAPLLRSDNVQAALNASKSAAGVEMRVLEKPTYVKANRLKGESEQEFIARMELLGMDPVLWLGTRMGRYGYSRGRRIAPSRLDASKTAGIPTGRLQDLKGDVFVDAGEDFRHVVRNLILDSGVIRGSLAWQREMRKFIEAISVRVDNVDEKTAAILRGEQPRNIVGLSESDVVVHDARNWRVITPFEKKEAPKKRVVTGVSDAFGDEATLKDLFLQETRLNKADIQAGRDYLLVPEYLYQRIERELDRISYQPTPGIERLDILTKQWRNFTLNIFPRTGFANLIGSISLALLAGAGPRSFYFAYKHMRDPASVPGPLELRQRFGMSLTTDVDFERLRSTVPQLDSPLGALAWWMNTMRRFNGISEDFGRLAVWYSRAFPEASRAANDSFRQRWINMRTITETAEEMLDQYARNDHRYAETSARLVDIAYQFVGDLHSGGKLNTVLRVFIPFQQWYRHILRLMLITMPVRYPGRTLFLQRVADIARMYQMEHGVYPPYMADVVPIYVEEGMSDLVDQDYVLGWRSSAVGALTTGAELFSGGEFNGLDYTLGMLTPVYKNAGLVAISIMMDGKAQRVSQLGLQPERDVYGRQIDVFSKEGLEWFTQLAFQSMPASSVGISATNQAIEGNLLLGGGRRLLKGSEGTLPAYAQTPAAPGVDALTGFQQLLRDGEFSMVHWSALGGRLVFGGSFVYIPRKGEITQDQFLAALRRAESEFGEDERRILQTLEQQRNVEPGSQP